MLIALSVHCHIVMDADPDYGRSRIVILCPDDRNIFKTSEKLDRFLKDLLSCTKYERGHLGSFGPNIDGNLED